MQAHHPFVHSPNYGGFWVATRAQDCLEIAKNAETFSNWPAEVIPALAPQADDPDQRRSARAL